MRLDKFLADTGKYTRSEAGKAIRGGRVTVNGAVIRDPSARIDENSAAVTADGEALGYQRYVYLMLNKPADTVSTTDEGPKSVMNLFPQELRRMGIFPCGRLDLDTVGFLLMTNDGQTAHELLAPKKHCEKTYRFTCLPLDDGMIGKLESGIELSDFTSKPCRVTMTDPTHGEITVTEGKYHQIKRMFHAVGSEILTLERITFAGLTLDPTLERGAWRELTDEETATIRRTTE